MTQESSTTILQGPVFRIDKFVVPPASMPAFMAQTRRVQRALGALPGCGQNLALTKTSGSGEFNVVTLVEWVSPDALAQARSFMQAQYAREGFDTEAFMKRLGVRADLALYTAENG